MFDIPFSSVMPASAVAGLALFAGAHYLVIAPVISARIAAIDHLPRCEADLAAMAKSAGERRLSDLQTQLPEDDTGQDFAADQVRILLESPAMQEIKILTDLFGLGDALDSAKRQKEELAARGRDVYQQTLKRLKDNTAASVAAAPSMCSCLTDHTLSNTRADWALFTGSLGLIRPASITNFQGEIAKAFGSGLCGVKAEDPR